MRQEFFFFGFHTVHILLFGWNYKTKRILKNDNHTSERDYAYRLNLQDDDKLQFCKFQKKNLMKALYQSYAVNDEHRISFRINFFHQKAYWKFLYYSTKNPSMLYPPRPGNVIWTWISLWLPFLMMNPFLWFIWVDFSIFLIVHTSKMHVNLLIKTWNIFLQSGAGHIS